MKKKLEVGKSYRTKGGDFVTMIEAGIGASVGKMVGSNRFVYDSEGRVRIACNPDRFLEEHGIDWGPEDLTFSPTQVSRLLDALNMARNGCSDQSWEKALATLEEALCPEDGKESQ